MAPPSRSRPTAKGGSKSVSKQQQQHHQLNHKSTHQKKPKQKEKKQLLQHQQQKLKQQKQQQLQHKQQQLQHQQQQLQLQQQQIHQQQQQLHKQIQQQRLQHQKVAQQQLHNHQQVVAAAQQQRLQAQVQAAVAAAAQRKQLQQQKKQSINFTNGAASAALATGESAKIANTMAHTPNMLGEQTPISVDPRNVAKIIVKEVAPSPSPMANAATKAAAAAAAGRQHSLTGNRNNKGAVSKAVASARSVINATGRPALNKTTKITQTKGMAPAAKSAAVSKHKQAQSLYQVAGSATAATKVVTKKKAPSVPKPAVEIKKSIVKVSKIGTGTIRNTHTMKPISGNSNNFLAISATAKAAAVTNNSINITKAIANVVQKAPTKSSSLTTNIPVVMPKGEGFSSKNAVAVNGGGIFNSSQHDTVVGQKSVKKISEAATFLSPSVSSIREGIVFSSRNGDMAAAATKKRPINVAVLSSAGIGVRTKFLSGTGSETSGITSTPGNKGPIPTATGNPGGRCVSIVSRKSNMLHLKPSLTLKSSTIATLKRSTDAASTNVTTNSVVKKYSASPLLSMKIASTVTNKYTLESNNAEKKSTKNRKFSVEIGTNTRGKSTPMELLTEHSANAKTNSTATSILANSLGTQHGSYSIASTTASRQQQQQQQLQQQHGHQQQPQSQLLTQQLQRQKPDYNVVDQTVHDMIALLQTYGPLTYGQLEFNLPPLEDNGKKISDRNKNKSGIKFNENKSSALSDILQILVALGILQKAYLPDSNILNDSPSCDNINGRRDEENGKKYSSNTEEKGKTVLYCIANGIPRPDVQEPQTIMEEIKWAVEDLVKSQKRVQILRILLSEDDMHCKDVHKQSLSSSPNSAPKKLYMKENPTNPTLEDQDKHLSKGQGETKKKDAVDYLSYYRRKDISTYDKVKHLLLNDPDIAFDPVYVTALRNLNIDINAIDRERRLQMQQFQQQRQQFQQQKQQKQKSKQHWKQQKKKETFQNQQQLQKHQQYQQLQEKKPKFQPESSEDNDHHKQQSSLPQNRQGKEVFKQAEQYNLHSTQQNKLNKPSAPFISVREKTSHQQITKSVDINSAFVSATGAIDSRKFSNNNDKIQNHKRIIVASNLKSKLKLSVPEPQEEKPAKIPEVDTNTAAKAEQMVITLAVDRYDNSVFEPNSKKRKVVIEGEKEQSFLDKANITQR